MGEKYLKTKDGSIEDVVKQMQNKVLESDYQDKFKKELDNAGKPLGHMTGMEKKEFYSKVDGQEIKEEKEMNEARWMVSGTMGYKGIGGVDGFEMVINANSERDAENKAEKELDKARAKRQIGPGGGGSIEDLEIEGAERTNDPLESPSHFRLNHFDPSIKEGKAPYRLSYDDKYGKHAGFEDAETLSDLQNKAQKLRAKGFKINKMGRNTSPVEQRLPEPEGKTEVSEIRIRPKSIVEFTSQQIKQAYGIANDPRYKQGNYSGAVAAIEKLAKGLSKHPDVAKVLKRTNEDYSGARKVFERIYKEVSDRLKLKVLDRKIKKAKDKFHKGLRRP